ncbi:hypothetical protein ACQ4LE_002273 [Meloidogyne hapla]
MNKIAIVIFLVRIFSPIVESLSTYGSTYNLENLPEYSEYLGRRTTTTTTSSPFQMDMPNFPTIQLCKESPGENNIYGHIFCWGMIVLYILFIISLLIFQFRSILWFKVVLPRKKANDIELLDLKIEGTS